MSENKLIELASGISIVEHDLNAEIELKAIPTAGSRNVGDEEIPSFFMKDSGNLLSFGDQSRDTGNSHGSMLELSNIGNPECVTPDNPLKIQLDATLTDDEVLLPFTFDGEMVLPIGTCDTTEDGKTIVRVEEIPDVAGNTRSLTRALKMVFYKLVLKKQDNQKLCWISFNEHTGKAVYNEHGLANKIKTAKNIILATHGIIGSSLALVRAVKPLIVSTEDKEAPYDLLLAFDYENLNTPIDDTARALKQLLVDAGIGSNPEQRLTITAHSMGGLVSRHMIEQEGGHEFVHKLILAGTPNGGSEIADVTTYRNWAIKLSTFAINFGFVVPAIVIGGLKWSKKITKTLEQMHPKSDFIQQLKAAPDPNVPYTVLAGSIDDYYTKNPPNEFTEKVYDKVAKLFFGDLANDIAVASEAIKDVPIDRKETPQLIDVPCNHFNYFEEDGALSIYLAQF